MHTCSMRRCINTGRNDSSKTHKLRDHVQVLQNMTGITHHNQHTIENCLWLTVFKGGDASKYEVQDLEKQHCSIGPALMRCADLPKSDPEGPNVCCCACANPAMLLRRSISWCPCASQSGFVRLHKSAQANICELSLTSLVQQDICRLHVEVTDSFGVQMAEGHSY